MYEFLLFLFYFWPISGLISFIAHFHIDSLEADFRLSGVPQVFFSCLVIGPFGLIMVYNAYRDDTKWERESVKRKAKLKATKEKKFKTAIDEFPGVMNEISADFNAIDSLDTKSLINFFKKIDKICGYCAALNSSQIENKDRLKEILIYSRLNVLSFYEKNSLNGSEKLAKKIALIIKKLK
tara:strand:- start:1524 stop:2066 length:543 start_codon:yes stop_codon:yes gene_type:complete